MGSIELLWQVFLFRLLLASLKLLIAKQASCRRRQSYIKQIAQLHSFLKKPKNENLAFSAFIKPHKTKTDRFQPKKQNNLFSDYIERKIQKTLKSYMREKVKYFIFRKFTISLKIVYKSFYKEAYIELYSRSK